MSTPRPLPPPAAKDAAIEPTELADALAETTAALVLVFDGSVLYANPAAVRVCGYDLEELLEMELASLLHPESRDLGAELVHELRSAERRPREIELRIRRRDGRDRWLRLTATAVEVHGRPAVLASGVDVSGERRMREELQRTRERLALVQRAARSVYWEWSPQTDRLSLTGFADEVFGFAVHRSAQTGAEFVDLVHPEDRDRLRRALLDTLRLGKNLAVDLRFIKPSGEIRWLSERGVALRDEAGWTHRIIGVAQDISERKIAEEALFQEKEKADVTLASIADGVLRTNDRGMIDYLNPVAQRLTGWSLAEAYGRPAGEIYRVVDSASGEPLDDALDQCLRERHGTIFAGDRMLADRDGNRHPIQDSVAPIRNRRGEVIGAVLIFRDLSRLRRIEREIDRLANHEPLTGLINRRAFVARIERILEEGGSEGRRHALCHFDLDNFRLVNETGGQGAGDRLIRRTAELIRSHLRDQDVLAHLGGDAFGVLFRDCSPAQAQDLAEEVRHAIRGARFVADERTFATPVSVGLVAIGPGPIDPVAPADGTDTGSAAALLRDADAACVVAKEKGGDRIHTYQPGDSALAERHGQMQWVARINKAFDEDRFTVYQQSIVPLQPSAQTEAPFCELLVRLVDEQGKIIGPGSFIPAAERFGMIAEIDYWVLRTALRQLAVRSRGGAGELPRFTLNLSGFSLGTAEFLDLVIAEFETTGVDPAQVMFEITETSAIADLGRAQRFLSALRKMGCRFILDDFGKGLSSLGYLRTLPLDFLKIDGSFVRNMTTDPIQTALVASIHEIGDVMGLRTIAESVEDEDTLEAVRRIGIDYAQGFLLSRPEPLLTEPAAGAGAVG